MWQEMSLRTPDPLSAFRGGSGNESNSGPSLFGGLDSGLDCGTRLWDWTVGLELHSSFLVTETTQEIHVYSFQLTSMRVFSCKSAVILVLICTWLWFVIRDPMLSSEENSYGIHWLLLANSRTQGGATRFEKDAASWAISMLLPTLTWAMLLFCWLYMNSRPQTNYLFSVRERH